MREKDNMGGDRCAKMEKWNGKLNVIMESNGKLILFKRCIYIMRMYNIMVNNTYKSRKYWPS